MGLLYEIVGYKQEDRVGFLLKQHEIIEENRVFTVVQLPDGIKTCYNRTLGRPIRNLKLETGKIPICRGFCKKHQIDLLQQQIEHILLNPKKVKQRRLSAAILSKLTL